jgi:hypothetical protein
MKRHHSLTVAVICEAVQRFAFGICRPGFCLVCGLEHDGVEPTARGTVECEACAAPYVYGAEEILLSVAEDILAEPS